jgi:hypothetical protein
MLQIEASLGIINVYSTREWEKMMNLAFFSWIFAFTERRSTIEIEELNSLKFVTKNDIFSAKK